MSETHPGFFIAIEGPDGSGKTTQAARLVEFLRGTGRTVVACREPGGTLLGDQLRSLVLNRSEMAPVLRAETLLYMASRAQLVEDVIRPALASGAVVVTDRYLLSNVVYQGYAGGLNIDAIGSIGNFATGGLLPDLTILVDVPPDIARARIGLPRDRIEDRPDSYRLRVRQGFLDAIASSKMSSCVIDGSAAPDDVASQIQSEVARALGIGSRS